MIRSGSASILTKSVNNQNRNLGVYYWKNVAVHVLVRILFSSVVCVHRVVFTFPQEVVANVPVHGIFMSSFTPKQKQVRPSVAGLRFDELH